MHLTAFTNAQAFFTTYGPSLPAPARILEIGSQDVNGSIRSAAPEGSVYRGLDFTPGPGVDVVLDDPYALPVEDNSADVVVSSSCFEHAEMFWLTFLEVMRVLKPAGLFYLNAPSNGAFHRFPLDCWRFYPDAGRALVTWGKRNGLRPALLESYTSAQSGGEEWNDFVAVFLKDEREALRYPNRILSSKTDLTNGQRLGSPAIERFSVTPEDRRATR